MRHLLPLAVNGLRQARCSRNCCIVRWNVSHPMALESNNASTHNATLRSGAEIPTKLARDRWASFFVTNCLKQDEPD
jgi:hypothetical protein